MNSQVIAHYIKGRIICTECLMPTSTIETPIIAGQLGEGEVLWCEGGCERMIDVGPLLFEEQHLAN
jgi:hypothetical protein